MSHINNDEHILSFTYKSDRIDVYESNSINDTEWNSFIEHTKNGQYEQTDYWSRLKKQNGWSPLRIIYRCDNAIIGGFLLLYKPLALNINIGYITRGPVFDEEQLIQHESLLTILKKCCDNYKIIFILIQQPDDSTILPELDKSPYLINNNSIGLVEANVQIDLSQSIDEIVSQFKRDKVKNIKKARKLNSSLREGSKEDLAQFFDLMLKSCERQHVVPQPDNLEYIQNMWDIFSERNLMRLFFIDVDGETISALLLIKFNNKAYKWKFGWSGKLQNSGINDYLYFRIIEWAKESGIRYLVDMGVDPQAQSDSNNTSSSSFRKIRFGGDVIVFPESYLFVSNRYISYVLKIYGSYRKLRLKVKKHINKSR